MNQDGYRLSIEEVAFAMGHIGGAEVASGFLLALLGEISEQEANGRLYSASHSLIARGYLDVDLESSESKLDETLAVAIGTLVGNDFSIRCSRMVSGDEQVLNFFVHGDEIVEHVLEKEVVSCLQRMSGVASVVDHCLTFFGVPAGSEAEPLSEPLGTIEASLVEETKDAVEGGSKDEIAARLSNAGLEATVADELAEDLMTQEYRGAILRVESQDLEAESGKGFLLLKSPERFWSFEIVPEEVPLARVRRGTPAQLGSLIKGFLS